MELQRSFARTLTPTPAPRPGPRWRRGRSKA
ncbi:SufE family protein, partial [Xanthomonas campestris pv. raphani]